MRILIPVLMLLVFVSPFAFANPPVNVDVATATDGKIQVMVQHPVGNPNQHYIYKIVLYVKGEQFAERTYDRQVGNLQVESFKVPGLKIGDKIKATAYCNRYGDKTGEMAYDGIPPPISD